MTNKFILSFLIFCSVNANAAILVEKLNCSAPAKNGHIFIETPAPQLKIISRWSFFGFVKNYVLDTKSEDVNSTDTEVMLEVSPDQPKEGWINLETEGTKVTLKEDDTKAMIEFHYGAKSKCKIEGLNF